MATSFPTLSPLSSAIAQAEGYGVSGAIPTLANNPGNLELGNLGYGTMNAAGGQQITVFPSAQAGATALENQVQAALNGSSANYNPNMSLSQFGNIYSGGNSAYGNTLASILGVSPNTPLSQANTGNSNSSWWQQMNQIGQQWGALPQSNSGLLDPLNNNGIFGSNPPSVTNLIFSSRLIVLIVGVILIAAGLFAFKPTQTILTSAAKKAGELAA